MLREGRYSDKKVVTGLPSGLREAARERVLDLFNAEPDARLVLHNYSFTVDFIDCLREIAGEEGAQEGPLLVAELAGWFVHTGRLYDYDQPAAHSLRLAEAFLADQQVEAPWREEILQCLRQALQPEPATAPPATWLEDAVQASTYLIEPDQRRPLLHLEWELITRQRLSKLEWAQLWLQRLFGLGLHTHTARRKFEQSIAEQIKKLKKTVEKAGATLEAEQDTQKVKPRRYHTLEKNRPTRAVQTFFRANYRNHINLSSIADNKANIMISVNSILISVLITILSYQNISENNPIILLPVVIFLVTGLASLIFAVLSARPKVTNLNQEENPEQIRKNIIFFGNFVHLDLEDYENAMDAVFRDNELLYGNMTRDLYYLGKVLDKKYRYLSISYNIFMLGFIATVGSFLIAILS